MGTPNEALTSTDHLPNAKHGEECILLVSCPALYRRDSLVEMRHVQVPFMSMDLWSGNRSLLHVHAIILPWERCGLVGTDKPLMTVQS